MADLEACRHPVFVKHFLPVNGDEHRVFVKTFLEINAQSRNRQVQAYLNVFQGTRQRLRSRSEAALYTLS